MSLAISRSGPFGTYTSAKRSEPRPRWLRIPNSQVDPQSNPDVDPQTWIHKAKQIDPIVRLGGYRKAQGTDAHNRQRGDDQPQQPDMYNTKSLSFGKSTLLKVPHPKPFHLGAAPGKRESPQDANPFHRVWMTDMHNAGRWNRAAKEEFYAKQDAKLYGGKPHDEMFATWSNRKVWVHLKDDGSKPGGQEKLEVRPPRGTGLHLKYGLYKGKFENVKHQQLIVNTGQRDDDGNRDDLAVDNRDMFDMNLLDDMIEHNRQSTLWATNSNFDIFRPSHTASCPEIGYHFCHRV